MALKTFGLTFPKGDHHQVSGFIYYLKGCENTAVTSKPRPFVRLDFSSEFGLENCAPCGTELQKLSQAGGEH